MKKTAFKTFVCSFVFSLFILFTINGLFFYTPEATSQNVKIPSKNISLFFMGDAGGAVSAKVRPIKKIALSLPLQKNRRRNRNRLRAGKAAHPFRRTGRSESAKNTGQSRF